jgi:hypothetical protein
MVRIVNHHPNSVTSSRGNPRQGETLMLNPKLSELDLSIVPKSLIEAAILAVGDKRVPDAIMLGEAKLIENICANPVESWIHSLVKLGTTIGAGTFKDSSSAALTLIMTAAAMEHVYRTQFHLEVTCDTKSVSQAELNAVKAKKTA